MTAIEGTDAANVGRAGTAKIVLASLVGTTIEFYDFYIFGTAAALVFGPMFFPKSAPETQMLNAYLTFGLAFLARPVGSFLFGHFGDRIGRKSTLVATMLTMGLATTLIGALPGYATAGVLAPWMLALLRFVQGVGLGGEWGGAALIAVENAPDGRRAWFGMFPQLGPPLGFFIATGLFLMLLVAFGENAFVAWAWRVPFLMSAVLVAIGLYVRMSLEETPAFRAALAKNSRVAVPLGAVLRRPLDPPHPGLAVDRRLLRPVLYRDGLCAWLWRPGAGDPARRLSRDAVRRDRLHGGGDAGFRGAGRPARPAAGADRRLRRGLRGRPRHAGAHGRRGGRRLRLSRRRARRDGADLRAARRAASRTLPDAGALHRGGQHLQSRRHSRRLLRALARPGSRSRKAGSPGSATTSPSPP